MMLTVLIDKFLDRAIELDVDCICDGKRHILVELCKSYWRSRYSLRDSACSLPPISIEDKLIKELETKTKAIALGLEVKVLWTFNTP